MQAEFWHVETHNKTGRLYRSVITAVENEKGVLDVDTVKGCKSGMSAYPGTGCYGECYAKKGASRYGVDFATSVSRRLTPNTRNDVYCAVRDHRANWYRIGVSGDPCHDWSNTVAVCMFLKTTSKVPVVITKHWTRLSDSHVSDFKSLGAVFNTSLSGLDTDAELAYRVSEMMRLRKAGLVSACRVVTCNFGASEWANAARKKQEYLLGLGDIIDTPLRASRSNPRVVSGDIILERIENAIGGGKLISLHSRAIYLGTCPECPDQCGVKNKT